MMWFYVGNGVCICKVFILIRCLRIGKYWWYNMVLYVYCIDCLKICLNSILLVRKLIFKFKLFYVYLY